MTTRIKTNRIEEAVRKLTDSLKDILWKPEARAALNRVGLDLLPAHFYSPGPTIDEIHTSFEYSGDGPPFIDLPLHR